MSLLWTQLMLLSGWIYSLYDIIRCEDLITDQLLALYLPAEMQMWIPVSSSSLFLLAAHKPPLKVHTPLNVEKLHLLSQQTRFGFFIISYNVFICKCLIIGSFIRIYTLVCGHQGADSLHPVCWSVYLQSVYSHTHSWRSHVAYTASSSDQKLYRW